MICRKNNVCQGNECTGFIAFFLVFTGQTDFVTAYSGKGDTPKWKEFSSNGV